MTIPVRKCWMKHGDVTTDFINTANMPNNPVIALRTDTFGNFTTEA